MKKGYCENCQGERRAIKKAFSVFWFIMTGGFYAIYRLLFVRRNKCSTCFGKLK